MVHEMLSFSPNEEGGNSEQLHFPPAVTRTATRSLACVLVKSRSLCRRNSRVVRRGKSGCCQHHSIQSVSGPGQDNCSSRLLGIDFQPDSEHRSLSSVGVYARVLV